MSCLSKRDRDFVVHRALCPRWLEHPLQSVRAVVKLRNLGDYALQVHAHHLALHLAELEHHADRRLLPQRLQPFSCYRPYSASCRSVDLSSPRLSILKTPVVPSPRSRRLPHEDLLDRSSTFAFDCGLQWKSEIRCRHTNRSQCPNSRGCICYLAKTGDCLHTSGTAHAL